MAKSNQNSSTEDDVGKLHGILTELHKIGLDELMRLAKENPEEAAFILDTKLIDRATKWVEYNGLGMQLAEETESILSKQLAEIKLRQSGKIIDFEDADGTDG